MNILIVGAGPTGLTAAVELARQGVIAKVIEKKPLRSTLSRAVGILPDSLKILALSGVSKQLIDKGVIVDRLTVYTRQNHLATISLDHAATQHPYLLALAQDKTEQILENTFIASGGKVNYGVALRQVRQTNEDVFVDYSNGCSERFDLLLAADGVSSQTRRSAGLDFPGFELAQTWSIADVDVGNWRHPGELTICLFGRGEVVVVVPLEANRYRLVATLPDVLAKVPLPVDITRIRRQGEFTVAVRQLKNYRSGRLYFAGDAAHCHSPVGGRGMNLGIADAAEFAQRLVNHSLDQYSQSRHAAGINAINESERLRKFITTSNPFAAVFRKSALTLINHSSRLQRLMANRMLNV